MDRFLINGSNSGALAGSVEISGAKNAALPILAAVILTHEPIVLSRVPHLKDVTTMLALLSSLGVRYVVDDDMHLELDASCLDSHCAPYDLVCLMRASFLVLGPLLARLGQAQVALPGGCAIGSRPIEAHLHGLSKLGVEFDVVGGYVNARVRGQLRGADIVMEQISVTGTENIMMAATLARGITRISNAACEPEVTDLANFLNLLGAKISGIGTSDLLIEGVANLHGGQYEILPDRIEAGTYLIGAAMTRGCITASGINPEILTTVLNKLEQTGADISIDDDAITLDMCGKRPLAVSITTGKYPGFPTDLQAQWVALSAVAYGKSFVHETIFENRLTHCQEIARMGAKFRVESGVIHIDGQDQLDGAEVMATDLRASASLVLAGVVARGSTIVHKINHIDRGYEHIEAKFGKIGADISRILGEHGMHDAT